ncbi:hypothetical protein F2Q70_00002920 [Brassica cretica]|uniref:Uncharacterized protein n=1 Tax=Brassica cretica TaxID=69181 RepID=A0A8S9IYN6_BRACR|nr:hypothetical protein F2Q70_00002920 [Brassica cretica]
MTLCRAFLEPGGSWACFPSEKHGLWMRFFINQRFYGFSSMKPEAGRTFVLEPGGWTDFRPRTRRVDGHSSWNPEDGWTFVLEPGGWMDLRPGTRRLVELLPRNLMVGFLEQCLPLSKPGSIFQCVVQLPLGRLTDGTRCVKFVNLEYRDASHSTFRRWVTRELFPRDSRSLLWIRGFNCWIMGSNETVVLFPNPEMLLGPKGRFWSLEAALDPEVTFRTRRTRRSFGNLEVPLDPEVVLNPEVSFRPGGRSEPRGSSDPEVVLSPEVTFGPGGFSGPGGSTFALYVICSLPESNRVSSSGSSLHYTYFVSLMGGWMQGSEPELLSTGTWRTVSCLRPG